MNDNMKRFVRSLMVSTVGKGVLPGKVPTAYLYNGVQLPPLPEWDKETYPYAVIFHGWFGFFSLCISESPWHGTGEDRVMSGYNHGEGMATDIHALAYQSNVERTEWEFVRENEEGFVLGHPLDLDGDGYEEYGVACIFWSNHNIISADGHTVIVSASEPVPLYESGE